MAITVNQQPDSYSPVYNPLIFVVTSDNIAELSFSYIFDIYWDGELQTRHRIPARPDNGKCVFDASRIIEYQITHDLDLTDGFSENSNSFLKFQVKFGEEYDVAGTVTLFTDLVVSENIHAFNSALDYFDFVDYDSTDYLLATGTTKKFLTNSPAQNIRTTEVAWLYSVCAMPSTYNEINIKVYNSAGTLQTTITLVNSLSGAEQKFVRWKIDMVDLVSSYPTYFIEGNYFEAYAVNVSTQISEAKRFYINNSCTKYDIYRLHWLNQLGGFDSFSFTLSSKENSQIEKSKYKRLVGSMSGSSFTYSQSDRSEHVLNTVVTDSVSINSNWISEAESVWLKELITSPIVFHERNGALVPITINENRYEVKRKYNEKLFNLSLTFNYAISNNRQRY